MNRILGWMIVLALTVTSAAAERALLEDLSADSALITWGTPVKIQVGAVYTHLARPVDIGYREDTLRGDIVDACIGVSPWPWLLLYGQVGASDARLDSLNESSQMGAGGLAGLRINLWQVFEGVQETAWRFTVQAAGEFEYRNSKDSGDGEVEWTEGLLMLPLQYHLSFARSYRNAYMAEFQSLSAYAGPAWSTLDGTWNRNGTKTDFEEQQDVGVVGGVDLWLLENLSFGARADWFDRTSFEVRVRYCF